MNLIVDPFSSDTFNQSAFQNSSFGSADSAVFPGQRELDLPVRIDVESPNLDSSFLRSLSLNTQSLEKSQRSIRNKLLTVRLFSQIKVKQFRSVDKIKKIKKMAGQWRQKCYALKQIAIKKQMDEIAKQFDLASNVAGEIEDYEGEAAFFVAYAGMQPEGIAIADVNLNTLEWLVVSPSNIKGANQIDHRLLDRVHGVGSKLVRFIVAKNLAMGGDGALEVNSADLSIGFYKHLGFVPVDEETPNSMILPSKVKQPIKSLPKKPKTVEPDENGAPFMQDNS